MTLRTELELHEALPRSRFAEVHRRTVDLPLDRVWPAALSVTAHEIRTLGPLLALRGLPRTLLGKRAVSATDPLPLLDVFQREGFVLLRRDPQPIEGRALVLFGAAGRFWSPIGNAPLPFDGPDAFLDFDRPDHAVTVCRLEAVADGPRTRIETETLVAGTDRAAEAKFAPYWALIRLPSGLIRRSWLAAIDRRAHRHAAATAGGDRPVLATDEGPTLRA
ncbi:MAG: hypothetical protein AAFZ07_06360 [Actinomycetota bacterium]